MTDFDLIVIGSGNAGLTAATRAQLRGAKTLLLERHNIPGGCATSFVRGDFEFEVALHQLSGMGTEEQPFVMRQLFDSLGIMDKIEVIEEQQLYRIVMPGEFDVSLPANWQELQEHLASLYPAESDNISRYFKLCESVSMESFMLLPQARKANDPALLKQSCPNYINYGLRPAKQVLAEFFSDRDLIAVLSAYWCYLGMPTKDLPFADMAMLIYAYAAFKPCHVKGGSQAISSALLESFMQAGGQVRFNTAAEKIITANNRISAVRTEHGETFSCRSVISNASSMHTFNELLDTEKPPVQAATDMKSRRLGTSAFVLYIGLDCPPEAIGVTAASTFIIDDRDEETACAKMKSLAPPSHTMLTCYNLEDTSFAPPGKSLLSVLCLQYGAPWEDVAAEDYAKTKYQFADSLLDHVERVFPNIRANIEELEVATPLTMMRYLNTAGGAIYGFEQNTQDSNLFRENIDAIDGLYMAGCWNGMGGFQPTYMLGDQTAKQVVKYLKTQSQNTEEVAHA